MRSEDYGVLAHVRNEKTFGFASGAFSLSAMWREAPQPLRFGLTIGKRNSPRSVDRALCKRVLREVARHRAPEFLKALDQRSYGLDISLRLCQSLEKMDAYHVGVDALKKALFNDANGLFDRLEKAIKQGYKFPK